MLEPDALAPALHAALVMPLTLPGKTGLEHVVTDERLKALGELRREPHSTSNRRRQVIVHNSSGQTAKMRRRSDVAVEESKLVARVVESEIVTPGIGQVQQQLPNPAELPILFYGHLEEVELTFIARAVDQWNEDLG
jgi:hypothetical protein